MHYVPRIEWTDEVHLVHPSVLIPCDTVAGSVTDDRYMLVDYYADHEQGDVATRFKLQRRIIPGPHEPDIEVLKRAGQYLRVQYPEVQREYRIEMFNHQRVYPSSWFLQVFKRIRAREIEEGRTIARNFRYFRTILDSFVQQGGPDRGIEANYDDSMKRIVLSRSDYMTIALEGQLAQLKEASGGRTTDG